jgi:hypothetical protein
MPKPRSTRSNGAVLRLLALAGLAAGVPALAAFTADPAEVITARRVDLVNQKGERQASLSADSSGILLTLMDAKGRATASFRLSDRPRLSIRNDMGREVVGLGEPQARNLAR